MMNVNHNLMPFDYFQDLLESNKSKKLINEFINDCINDLGMSFTKIDKIEGRITYLGQYYNSYGNPDKIGDISYDFDSYFEIKILQEKNKAKNNFRLTINHLIQLGQSIHEFLEISRTILTNLELHSLIHYQEYSFVKDAISELSRNIAHYDDFGNNDVTHSSKSFCWDNEDRESKRDSLFNLYKLVVIKYKLIECSKSDFFSAFSNGEIKNGLKWLHLTNNDDSCKTSLIYFIKRLQDENFIFESEGKKFNDKILYVFRDNKGNIIENIRSSKSKLVNNGYQYDFIDEIISDLI